MLAIELGCRMINGVTCTVGPQIFINSFTFADCMYRSKVGLLKPYWPRPAAALSAAEALVRRRNSRELTDTSRFPRS
ncbi:hypothetical protein CEXT_113671 [Caerostris extrusa]|uniref:Uncharacterized protein n=1 Tax=Caerostris extrusa TaxID=172846 RepID=A0AAV4QYX3_CAEEX|nr:hypothetical protein CEXT_113671 [Caerostris extrusa]